MEHNFREYQKISQFWAPSPDVVILQPWHNPKYAESVSAPVVIYTLIQMLKLSFRATGDVAEFGVFQGGSARIMANELQRKGKKLHLLDTFCGMPAVSKHDNFWQQGWFHRTSAKEVLEKFQNYDFVEIHAGLFQETTSKLAETRFSFVHVDCDIYESVKFVSEFVFPRMNPGGIIVYDDYGDFISKGARLAVDEFFADKEQDFIYLPTRQAVVFI